MLRNVYVHEHYFVSVKNVEAEFYPNMAKQGIFNSDQWPFFYNGHLISQQVLLISTFSQMEMLAFHKYCSLRVTEAFFIDFLYFLSNPQTKMA